MRKTKFQNNRYYHIFNRGVDKREIFSDRYDYVRFLESLKLFNRVETIGSIYEFNYQPKRNKETGPPIGGPVSIETDALVEIVVYALLPNHFHLLLEQKKENGISEFMKKLGGGYTGFYNKKHKRSGSLFQGSFKSVYIDSESYLNYLSAYINANPQIHGIEIADKYNWSSYQNYLNIKNEALCNKEIILKDFIDIQKYKEYVNEVIKNASEIKSDKKKYLIE